ncbi:MAG TPA: FAD-dependent oxidoreductase [Pyrinomonadaceae bacterium]|jgi:sulfide:quinone oxidoreductase|nr:FAD-dependent oxidoreductase [Pyrinomonadaceae bacterium]
MANVLILGGGFAGVVAAERLANALDPSAHQVTLVSRARRFTFYPALVRLAFGECEPDDISYDLRSGMHSQGVRFVEATAARVDPSRRGVRVTGPDFDGELKYDFLVYALGRRLATERVKGFYEHAHHLLSVESALRFGEAVRGFEGGRAVVGSCPGARLEVPAYETAFALARRPEAKGARITLVNPDYPGEHPGGGDIARAVSPALESLKVEVLNGFPVAEVTAEAVIAEDGREVEYDLLMLVPPFEGASALAGTNLVDGEGFVRVDHTMRALGAERVYAAGDAVYFSGPKMGHMAVRQAAVAADNLAAEIGGREPPSAYEHELKLVVDADRSSVYLHKNLWDDGGGKQVSWGVFWSWAKRVHERHWRAKHS